MIWGSTGGLFTRELKYLLISELFMSMLCVVLLLLLFSIMDMVLLLIVYLVKPKWLNEHIRCVEAFFSYTVTLYLAFFLRHAIRKLCP